MLTPHSIRWSEQCVVRDDAHVCWMYVLAAAGVLSGYAADSDSADIARVQYFQMLEAAEFAVAFVFVLLLFAMMFVLPLLMRRLPGGVRTDLQLPDEGPEWAELNIRREILDERLQIDVPRLCPKRGKVCACWSFCSDETEYGALEPCPPEYSPRKTSPGQETKDAFR